MHFRRSRYYFGEAFRGLTRNGLMSIASMLTVASCILIVSVFYCLAANIAYFMQQLEDTIEISIFVEEELDLEGLQALHQLLLNTENITNVHYISSQEVYDSFVESFPPGLLDGVPIETFRRTFVIELQDIRHHEGMVKFLESEEMARLGVANVTHGQDVVTMMMSISNVVRWASFSLIFVLAMVAIIIITNTIRITVNARKSEISIMKYVGATDWFIRWPFVIEGILIGLMGSIISIIVVWLGYPWVARMANEFPIVDIYIDLLPSFQIFSTLFPFSLLIGALIGTIGSGSSVRRYLKV